jgi:hypothetical protein
LFVANANLPYQFSSDQIQSEKVGKIAGTILDRRGHLDHGKDANIERFEANSP